MIYRDGVGEVHVYDSALVGGEPPMSWQDAGRQLDARAQQLREAGEAKDYSAAYELAKRQMPAQATVYADVRSPQLVRDADLEALKVRYGVKFPKALTAKTGRDVVAVIMQGLMNENPNQNYGDLLHALLDRDVELRRAYARS